MLENKKTFEKFGYYYENLSDGSKKPIILTCDYCGTEVQSHRQQRVKSNKYSDKDACFDCRYKKREDVSLGRDGVKNSSQRKEVKEKISDKNSERLKSEEYKTQFKQTIRERYGVDHPSYSKEIRDKVKKTNLEKYGVEYTQQAESVKAKTKETNLKRYGAETFFGSKDGKNAKKEGMIKKYGVENYFAKPGFLDELKAAGYVHHMKNEAMAMRVGKKSLETKIKKNMIKIYNGKTVSQLRQDSGYSDSRFRTLINEYGFDEALSMTPRTSCLESVIRSYLSEIGVDYLINQKIEKYKPDIVVGDLMIECDGLYWHCDANCPDNNYHSKKRDAYANNGYRSLFFREDEIREKLEVVKSIIKNALRMNENREFARNLPVEEISSETAREFTSKYHLMGGSNSASRSYSLGGVAVIQFKHLGEDLYDVARFCTLPNLSVVGGFSKLVSYFIKTVKPRGIQTFVDLRYGTGEYLLGLGFEKSSRYNSFRWTDGKHTFHRLRFPGNSGYESGLCKIWDCGQQKYTWRP